jgi:thymidylate synthase
MRIYLDPVEAITDIGRELKKCSTEVHTQTYQNKDIKDDPDFLTKEIQAFEFCVINMGNKDQMPGVTLEWCNAEFKERIQSDFMNPGNAYKLRPEVWDEFLVDKYNPSLQQSVDVFDYTYNERIQWQISPIIAELRKNPDTRQAIIEVHDRARDTSSMGKNRIPCSMFYHFMIRDGKLDVIYVMRSSDFATHFQNDIWLADELRKHIAKMLMIEPGKFFMFVSSLHVYKRDWEKLKNY